MVNAGMSCAAAINVTLSEFYPKRSCLLCFLKDFFLISLDHLLANQSVLVCFLLI